MSASGARAGDQLDVRLTAGRHAPAEARRSLELVSGLDPETLERVRLLVSELVTNSVRHAGLSIDDPVHLRVVSDREHIRVEVTDPGPGFEPAVVPLPDPEGTSKWGLYLVNRIADRWGVSSDGESRVWAEFSPASSGN
jgi:anti-sigma regulatory factor (Ser/Thr protein kinase)